MSAQLMIWPILLPLVVGGLHLLIRGFVHVHHKQVIYQRLLNLSLLIALVVIAIILYYDTSTGQRFVYLAGNWVAPFGIVYVLDSLSALMILLTAIVALAAFIYSWQANTDTKAEHFHPFYALQIFGINGALLTGDVFNLFVFFEVLLLASYGLLVHGGGAERTKASLHFVIINLVGSSLFLIAVATIYGIVGTLNIADIAIKVSQLPADSLGIVGAAAILLLCVFGIKSAMFPFYFWLPQAYPQANPAIVALFAIMTKVGVYSIIRIHGTIFGENAGALADLHIKLVLVLGMITAIVAAFGAISAKSLRTQVAYLVLASVSTILIGIGINSPQALSATIYYLVHSTFIVAAMFLWVDVIVKARAVKSEGLDDKLISPESFSHIVFIGALFMVMAISISGMPPLSGFLGKVLILNSSFNGLSFAWAISIFLVLIVSGLLIIISLARSGSKVFYQAGSSDDDLDDLDSSNKNIVKHKKLNYQLMWVPIFLFLLSPLMSIFAGVIIEQTDKVAKQYFDKQAYIDQVLSTKRKASPNTSD